MFQLNLKDKYMQYIHCSFIYLYETLFLLYKWTLQYRIFGFLDEPLHSTCCFYCLPDFPSYYITDIRPMDVSLYDPVVVVIMGGGV